MGYHRNFLDAFHEKVRECAPDQCWPWTAARYHDGYGVLGIRNQGRKTTMRAHVFALVLATGEDAGGRFALHACDNPPCCNPAHLRWGNQVANIADMDSRGRARRPIWKGVEHPRAKLTDEDVQHVRAAYASGQVSQRELGEHFGVSQVQVSRLVAGKSWSHME